MDDSSRRVSDLERDQTVASLRDDLVAGRLTLDEFSERIEVAFQARVGRDLELARKDLPQSQPPVPSPGAPRRRPTRLTTALFGHVVRRGRIRLGRRTQVVSIVGDVDLDLREAETGATRVTVGLLTLFGNVDVYLPEGIDVDVGGVIVFGHRREWGRDAARPDSPLVRVRAHGVFGTVDVWRVPHDARGDYGEITRALQGRQKELPA